MRYGSVCSGIEAATVAWQSIGWEAAWFSEIAAFPNAVLAHHYPDVKNVGDMNGITQMLYDEAIESPDILCGGTPCQAFSTAGLRQSLKDDRGNLSLLFCEVANAIDDVRTKRGQLPAIIVWENVPGVFSTADNAFGCFLAGLVGESEPVLPSGKKWANAGIVVGPTRTATWRILDAQYFGLAQRRKRVFVVASARTDIDLGQVLFDFEGLQRDTPPSREKAKEDTANSQTGTGGNDRAIGLQNVSPTLRANVKQSLMSGGGDINSPLAISYSISSMNSLGMLSENRHVGFKETDISQMMIQDLFHKKFNLRARRLTPKECERLQGFPDDYTKIPYKGKLADECPDSLRYHAIGNSWPVPVITWIGKRINVLLNTKDGTR